MTAEPKTDAERLALVRERIRAVPDFPKPGILFRDITPVLADPVAMSAALQLHLDALDGLGKIDRVVGIESRGFLFGMAIAERVGAGFVPVRKPGKLPAATESVRYDLEYGSDELHVHADAIEAGHNVVIVDDLLATGGTAGATRQLIETLGGKVSLALFLIELTALQGRTKLQGVPTHAIVAY
jgi:adenine phosphoribosyltransferase